MNTKNEREYDAQLRARARDIILAADDEKLDRIIATALLIRATSLEQQKQQDDQRGI